MSEESDNREKALEQIRILEEAGVTGTAADAVATAQVYATLALVDAVERVGDLIEKLILPFGDDKGVLQVETGQ